MSTDLKKFSNGAKALGQIVTVTIQQHYSTSMVVTFIDENNVVQYGRMSRKESGFTPQELFDLKTKGEIPDRFKIGMSFDAEISMYGYDEYKYWLTAKN